MPKWLISWEKRDQSGPINDNFLWQSDTLFVMDNHRLALWCWWQYLDNNPGYLNFVHIDRHYDALWHIAKPWNQHATSSHRSDLESFRNAKFYTNGDELSLYRWDAIVSALHVTDKDRIREWSFSTAKEGMIPSIPEFQIIDPWDLPASLNYLAQEKDNDCPSIIDIDLDYFTQKDLEGHVLRIFSKEYINDLNSSLIKGISNGNFCLVTIALSPETTGSWSISENLCRELLKGIPHLSHLIDAAP